ncbi:selenocysteine-specific translation elongation factor [Persicirhabdus sediminis]|uniref:Selenocysteine-specific translation elongation factor n=1 Tax=Persicirhabdus sediminis TaxID=454144 RepID=A0A8J7MD81_9BACT|nr:selenocysteine-specific translation elongation factor [Persicirhabdus sediminis]MBK1790415.1 selenocysteine-specific translation elongation factor [Persicirhabdus sediminis]
MDKHFILGTAGHIDHGKSSLIQSLTGTNPDRLPEEKSRGVTIELGFAHAELSDAKHSYQLGIVDVPGHADFVNNMVAGVSALDLVVFCVAADDGWMPQSEEHLQILQYLGINEVIIALTKCDICSDIEFATELVREEIAGSGIAEAQIIPISAHTGDGLDELKLAIIKNLAKRDSARSDLPAKLAVDRVFSPRGVGTVVTGTLVGGPIQLGESLICLPSKLSCSVRNIQNHNSTSEVAVPGSRTALNLPDLSIAANGKAGVHKGDYICATGIGKLSDTLDVFLSRDARPIGKLAPRTLKHTEKVMLHHGAHRVWARVILHGTNELQMGEQTYAQLRLDEAHFFQLNEHAILRDGAQSQTLAGVVVLDPLAERAQFRSADRLTRLEARWLDQLSPESVLQTELERTKVLAEDRLLTNHQFSDAELTRAVNRLKHQNVVNSQLGHLVLAEWWLPTINKAKQLVLDWHNNHPEQTAMPSGEWEKQLELNEDRQVQLVLATLCADGFKKTDKGIASNNHLTEIPAELESLAEQIYQTITQAKLLPPAKTELLTTPQHQQVYHFLIRSGRLLELDGGILMTAEQVEQCIAQVKAFILSHGQATASELRQELATNRKLIMPFLEMLDAEKITLRDGNFRTLIA